MLLERGLPINATDASGRTALHGAALQGYDDVIKFLVANGAELDVKDAKGFTALDTALGRAGGFGFSGREGVVRPATAAVLRELMGENARRASSRRHAAELVAARFPASVDCVLAKAQAEPIVGCRDIAFAARASKTRENNKKRTVRTPATFTGGVLNATSLGLPTERKTHYGI